MLTRDMIPYGRENAISRPELCEMTGLLDRQVRRQIAELRAEDSDRQCGIIARVACLPQNARRPQARPSPASPAQWQNNGLGGVNHDLHPLRRPAHEKE